MTRILEGKVAVITGGTRGLGMSVARAFISEGASVVIAGRTKALVERAVAELGPLASGLVCDVTKAPQVESLAAMAVSQHGKFDIWVNNAAVTVPYGPTFSIAPSEADHLMETNILGVYRGSRAALAHFLPRGSGKLINILGLGARRSAPMQNLYAASKAWIRSFTSALAREYQGSGVGVFAFGPGMMRTDMLLRPTVVAGHERRLGNAYQTVLQMRANPPEIPAAKVVWLASSATDGRTGLEIELLGFRQILAGMAREGFRRLLGRRSTPEVQLVPVQAIPFGDPERATVVRTVRQVE